MTNFNPKQGEMISVRDGVDKEWSESKFVCYYDGRHHCAQRGSFHLRPWVYAKALPSMPEPIPFNHETWPRQAVWVRVKGLGNNEQYACVGVDKNGIKLFAGYYKWDALASEFEMSVDHGATWQPCHYTQEQI